MKPRDCAVKSSFVAFFFLVFGASNATAQTLCLNFVSFSAQKNTADACVAVLDWRYNQCESGKYYVEYSNTGSSFKVVGSLEQVGGVGGEQSYRYLDYHASSGNPSYPYSYYRVRFKSDGGNSYYSPIRSVYFGGLYCANNNTNRAPLPSEFLRLVNQPIPNFQSWASMTRTVVTGDFNGDSRTDMAAVGANGWLSLPVALSNGDGSFRLVDQPIPNFQSWASMTRTVVTGDFNGDGRTDMAAVGANGWQSVPVALSNGDGSFRVADEVVPNFQSWASMTRTVVTGDFNGDGRTDMAAVGANGWLSLPVILSYLN